MASLTGQTIQSTYDALLKISGNDALTSSLQRITDGLGNFTPLYLSTTGVEISSGLSVIGNVTSSAFVKTGGTAFEFLKADGTVDTNNYVTFGRTLTINGTTYDLSANRTWSVGTITGSGTANYISKFTGSSALGNSQIFDNGTNVLINSTSPEARLTVENSGTSSVGIYGGASGTSSKALAGYATGISSNGVYGQGDGYGGVFVGGIAGLDSYSFDGHGATIRTSNGNGLIVNKQLSTGNRIAQFIASTSEVAYIDFSGNIRGNSFIKSGGTSSQFLKADGSVDSTSYLPLTGGTLTGTLNGTNITASSNIEIKNGNQIILFNPTNTQYFDLYTDSSNILNFAYGGINPKATLSASGNFVANGTITGSSIIKSGGTSSQFLKADGSVDSNTYALNSALSDYVTLATNQTISGTKTFTTLDRTIFSNADVFQIRLFNTSDSSKRLDIGFSSDNANIQSTTGGFIFRDTTSEKMVITSAGNIGIGTTSPDSAGGYSTLTVNGSSGGQITIQSAGTKKGYLYSTSSSLILGADTSTPLIFDAGATERMRITPSGNVGIGTTDASALISGTERVLKISSSGVASLYLESTSAARTWANYANTSGNLVWYDVTAGAARMNITSSGNVGIGTTSPDKKLHVSGSDTVLRIQSGTGGVYMQMDSGASSSYIGQLGTSMYFENGGSERMRITSGGNVGIGTSSPSLPLHIYNSGAALAYFESTNANGAYAIWRNSGTSIGDVGAALGISGSGSASDFMIASRSGNMILGTGSSEKMRITSGGNVGIGMISPTGIFNTGSKTLRIASSSTTTPSEMVLSRGTSISDVSCSLFLSGSTDDFGVDSTHPLNFLVNIDGTERMRITSGGEVYIAGTTDQGAYNLQVNGTGVWGAGAYVNGSDARLKNNISEIGSTLELVNKMKPVSYKYNEEYSKDQSIQTGFIAQDLQEVFAGQDYLEGLVKEGGEHLSVAYQNLIPVLVKAIQELTAKVEQLENNK